MPKHIAEQFSFPFMGDHRIAITVNGEFLVSIYVDIKPKNLREALALLQEAADLQDSPVVEDKDLI